MSGPLHVDSLPDALKDKQFACGDLIVAASPLVHVISMKYNGVHCDWCALPARSGKLLKCAACQYEYYCDKRCQRSAWKYHKFECPLLKVRYPKVPTDSVRLFTKVMWNMAHGIDRPQDDPGWRGWNDLCHHLSKLKMDTKRVNAYLKLMYTIRQYVGELNMEKHGMLFNSDDMLMEFGRLVFNGFTLTHMTDEIGAAVYISPSVFNHSCSPNAAHVCDGIKLYVRAIQAIDTSKENIYVNYIDPMMPREARLTDLYDSYYFHCECAKCSNLSNEAMLESTICPNCEGLVIELFDHRLLCSGCKKYIDDSVYISSCERAVSEAAALCTKAAKCDDMDMGKVADFLKSNRLLSPKNVSLASIKCTVYADLSQYGKPAQAYNLGEEITELLKLYYPKVFPAHGVHQWKQARLAWHCDTYDKALDHYKQALKSLKLTHGPNHKLTKLVESDIPDCARDKSIYEMLHNRVNQ